MTFNTSLIILKYNLYLRIIIYFLVIFSTLQTYSQNIKDTVNQDIDMFESIKISLQERPKFYISLDNKNSFISNRSGWFLGAKVGLEYNYIFRYGLGFYALYNQKYATYVNGIKESEEYLSFNYGTIFGEYIFKSHKKYDFSLPISLGFGSSWTGNYSDSEDKYLVILYEAQLIGTYYLFKFLGIGAGVGYRIMLLNNPHIDEQFTAPIYSIKVKLDFGKIFQMIKNK